LAEVERLEIQVALLSLIRGDLKIKRLIPHFCHILCTDHCFIGTGSFRVAPVVVRKDLEEIFRHKVFRMLLSKGKITEELVSMLMSWRHSGFNVFCGPCIYPLDETAMENLARYIIRASFSQERMSYAEEERIVVYRSKDGKEEKIFDGLEWLAAMCFHVPVKGEQMVRYYVDFSNLPGADEDKDETCS